MSPQDHYIIDLSRLPVGTHEFDIQLHDDFFASLEKSEILSGEVAAKAVMNLREEGYKLTMTVQGTVFVVCDRCLDPMPIDIDANDEIVESEESRDESLDLSWLVYEIASINIPIVHSHQAGECNKQMELLLHDHLCAEPEPEN